MAKKILHILGTGRSGSTILDLVLGNNTEGFSCGEVCALFRPWHPSHLTPSCTCDAKSCFWSNADKLQEKDIYRTIFETFPLCEYIVDSSKELPWVIDQTRISKALGYRTYAILMYKNPIDYSYSLWKRGIFHRWKRMWIRYHKQAFESLSNIITVEYKDFAQNPVEQLHAITHLLDIPFCSQTYTSFGKKYHLLYGSTSVRKILETKTNSGIIITYKPPHEQDFEFLSRKVQQETQESPLIKEISKQLADRNVLTLLRKRNQHQSVSLVTSVINKPIWYYLQKEKRKVKGLNCRLRSYISRAVG